METATAETIDIHSIFKKIKAAKSFKDLMKNDNAAKEYRQLAKIVHPDMVPDPLKKEATMVFARLLTLFSKLDGIPSSPATTVIAGYVVKSPLSKGDICDLYLVESVKYTNAVLKIVRSPKDNDLLDNEIATLKTIYSSPDNPMRHYIPEVLASFKASGRRVVVLPYAEGYISLSELLAMYPAGVDFRHIVWMGNRLFSAIGYAHSIGLVHGAVISDHLLYHPTSHDLRLVDWCYSAKIGDKIPAIARNHVGIYPPEVMRKNPATPATDIYMAARVLLASAHSIPRRFIAFFEHCSVASPASRPSDAWKTQDVWQSLARDEYGVPTYIPLTIKSN